MLFKAAVVTLQLRVLGYGGGAAAPTAPGYATAWLTASINHSTYLLLWLIRLFFKEY